MLQLADEEFGSKILFIFFFLPGVMEMSGNSEEDSLFVTVFRNRKIVYAEQDARLRIPTIRIRILLIFQ
jgi:hypothetical protein